VRIAPSTYFLRKARAPDPTRRPACAKRDDELPPEIQRVWDAHFHVYGPRRVWRQLRREDVCVARCSAAADAACLRSGWRSPDGLVHHSDRGTQYLSMRYTDRLADAGIAPSVGSRGDSYDALAESVIELFRTEVIRQRGPSRTLEVVELATLEWVDGFNHRRLLEPIGYVPPAEYEARHYQQAPVA
jgi:transposase InsO family protein